MVRTISRFGREYVEYDPSGGGGPVTWILSSSGSGSSGGASTLPSGVFRPATPGGTLNAAAPLYMPRAGEIDAAQAIDDPNGLTPHPWEVIGLAASNAIDGQKISIVTDGQMQLTDWTPITGAMDLESGKTYYLSQTTAGCLQTVVPSGSGVTVVAIGRAISARTLEVEIDVQMRLS